METMAWHPDVTFRWFLPFIKSLESFEIPQRLEFLVSGFFPKVVVVEAIKMHSMAGILGHLHSKFESGTLVTFGGHGA